MHFDSVAELHRIDDLRARFEPAQSPSPAPGTEAELVDDREHCVERETSHRTRCGMLAFTDDLPRAGLEGGDPAAEKLLGQATHRAFKSCDTCASMPSQFHAFRGATGKLDDISYPGPMGSIS